LFYIDQKVSGSYHLVATISRAWQAWYVLKINILVFVVF